MKIILIGFATSYKSSVGAMLSHKLDMPLFDVDSLVEQRQNQTVQQIFDIHGEEYFRELENAVIGELCCQSDCVIACGGGSVLAPNFDELSQNAQVFWLQVNGKNVKDRLIGNTRPLFDNLTLCQLEEKIQQRNEIYVSKNGIAVDTNDKTSMEVFAKIIQMLGI